MSEAKRVQIEVVQRLVDPIYFRPSESEPDGFAAILHRVKENPRFFLMTHIGVLTVSKPMIAKAIITGAVESPSDLSSKIQKISKNVGRESLRATAVQASVEEFGNQGKAYLYLDFDDESADRLSQETATAVDILGLQWDQVRAPRLAFGIEAGQHEQARADMAEVTNEILPTDIDLRVASPVSGTFFLSGRTIHEQNFVAHIE